MEPDDQRILDYLLERVGFAVKTWTMLNQVTADQKPRSEAERRSIVRALLGRVKFLLHQQAIRRAGRVHVYLPVPGQPPPLSPFVRNIPRRRRRVRRKQVSPTRLTYEPTAHNSPAGGTKPAFEPQVDKTAASAAIGYSSPDSFRAHDPAKTKSADFCCLETQGEPATARPEDERAGLAARIKRRITSIQAGAKLARHRWAAPKIWTGYVDGEHCWRGRRVLLPDGVGGELVVARRGVVVVFADERASILESRFRKLEAHQLVLSKLPEAVLLGARKRGKKERPSEAKQAAAKRNGARPVRCGSRPRGRPRKSSRVVQEMATRDVTDRT